LTGNCSHRIPPHLGREIDIPELPGQLAYCTFHPKDQQAKKYPFINEIQKGKRIVSDIVKLKTPALEKPREQSGVYRDVVGFDTEFDNDDVYTLAIAKEDRYVTRDSEKLGRQVLINDKWDNRIMPGLMEGKFSSICAHYIQVDLDALVRLGVSRENWLQGINIYDTFVLAKMENPNLLKKYFYGVEDVLTRLYRAPNWKHETEVLDPAKPLSWGLEKRKKRCGYDAWASLKIFDHPKIQQVVNRSSFVTYWIHRMIPTYHRMKYTGVMIDRTVFDEQYEHANNEEQTYKQGIEPQIRESFHWPDFELSNDNHLRDLLYKKYKYPVLKKTKSGLPSVDADALEQYISNPLVKNILEWRSRNKLMTTWYGKEAKSNSIPLYHRVTWGEEIGHLPVNIGVGQTSTLRRQSEGPNIQNWAKETRKIITTRFQDKGSLVWCDFEKGEPFILADELKSEKLREYFQERGGYLGIAKDLLRTNAQKGDSNYVAVKATVLAANYYAKPYTLANQLFYKAGIRYSDDWPTKQYKSYHYERCQQLIESYYRMFPEIYEFFMATRKELIANQGVMTRFGYFRSLPCPKGDQTPGFNHLLNTAINVKIQSSLAFVVGIAAVLIEELFVDLDWDYKWQDYHSYLYHHKKTEPWKEVPYLCAEVHDELVSDCPLSMVSQVKEVKEYVMTKKVKEVIQKDFPDFDPYLNVEMGEGRYWYGE